MNTRSAAIPAFMILVCALLSACTFVKSPEVEHLGVREISLEEGRAVYGFRFRATNPNRDPIPLGEVTYTLTMNGEEVFSGVRSPQATLDAYGDREFEVPAVIDRTVVALEGIVDYRINGELTYIPPGRFAKELFRTRVSVPSVSFSEVGRVDVSRD